MNESGERPPLSLVPPAQAVEPGPREEPKTFQEAVRRMLEPFEPRPDAVIVPPGHKIIITIDADSQTRGAQVIAYKGAEQIGVALIDGISDDGQLQEVIDQLTGRGILKAEDG